jgi:hypothetical protein
MAADLAASPSNHEHATIKAPDQTHFAREL